ncbi:hypothetical protein K8I61_09040 [bacterium]|nr:hypothetical protein [bacterium]
MRFQSVLIATLLVVTVAQAFLPLIGDVGYEAAQLQTFFFAIAAGHLAIARFRRERPRAAALWPHIAGTTGVLLGVLVANVAILAFAGVFRGLCDVSSSLLWFAILPAPTIAYASALGVLCAAYFRRAHRAYLAIVLLHLGWEVWVVWQEPVVFAFNTLLGYFPGPVYDRAVRITAALAASRAQALALAAASAVAARLVLRRAEEGEGARFRLTFAEGQLFAAALLAFFVLAARGETLGVAMTRAVIAERLGARYESANATIHYPEDVSAARLREIVLDVEFRFAQQAAFLGIEDPDPVTAFFYRGEREKKRLQGAGSTQYADCAHREMHMNIEPPPHRVLKHEIVHVLGSDWGITGLGYSPVLGLTEGLAVASEKFRDEYTIPQWAAAMKRVGRLPDIAAISGPTGFWRLQGRRSYLAWGGFVTWLLDTHGLPAVSRVYRTGGFERAFNKPLAELADEWEASLDAVDVPPRLLRIANYAFFRPSLFEERCARRVARLSEDADRAARSGRYKKAARLFTAAYETGGEHPRYRSDIMRARFYAEDLDAARELAETIVATEGAPESVATAAVGEREPGGTDTVRPPHGDIRAIAEARLILAEIAWRSGDLDAARAHYRELLALDLVSSYTREAAIALAAMDDEFVEPNMRRYFTETRDLDHTFLLTDALKFRPQAGYLHYLLGRRLANDRHPVDAARALRMARHHGLPHAELEIEAWLTLGETLYEAGDYEQARRVFAEEPPADLPPGLRMLADEWAERCAFAKRYAAEHELP